ncbi:MAG: hypothetical protein ABI551_19500 [Polyangiaceae bacterium]
MRYFSRGWANGELTDAESDAASDAYDARLDEIASHLPASVLRLVREVGLHDALFERLIWSPGKKHLRVGFVVGTSVVGYTTVMIGYDGAMLGRRRVDALRRAVSDREAVVLYQEVDIDDHRVSGKRLFTHRLLFDPSEEVSIDCEEMSVTFGPRADPRVTLGHAFVVEYDDSEP